MTNNKLIAFDIDGVLLDSSHRDHLIPDDATDLHKWSIWNRAGLSDTPIQQMCNLAAHMMEMPNINVVFTTSRNENARPETLEMLRFAVHKSVMDSHIMMRHDDDLRPACDVKVDMLKSLSTIGYEVVTVFDDCTVNVATLTANGFPAVLVGSPVISDNSLLMSEPVVSQRLRGRTQ